MQVMQTSALQTSASVSGSFAEMATFFREERTHLEARLERQQEEMKQQREEWEAKLEHHRQEIERLRTMLAARPQAVAQCVDKEQLGALQLRLQSMYEAKLLTDAEMHSAEDVAIDCIELMRKAPMTATTDATVDKAATMVLLSENVATDSSFARQLRRRKVL